MTLRVETPDEIPRGVVVFHPMSARREGASVILGNDLSGKFLEVGVEGWRAVELMQGGVPWERVAHELRRETGREFDVPPFLRKLSQLGFVRAVGPMLVWDGQPPAAPRPAHPAWKLLRYPATLVAAAALALAGAVLLVRHPGDLMTLGDLLFSRDPLLTLLSFAAISWGLVVLHEGAHYGMARSYGIPSSIRLGTRLHALVAETDVTRAWSLPRRQRAAILLAGPAVNAALLGAGEIAWRAWQPEGHAGLLLRMTMLANLLQLVFQSLLFVKADGYYLLVAVGPERNLRARAWRALRSTISPGWRECGHCKGHSREPGACALCGGSGKPATRARRLALAAFGLFTLGFSSLFLAYGLSYIATGTVPFLAFLGGLVTTSRATGDWRQGAQALAVAALIVAQLALVAYLSARRGLAWWRGRRATDDPPETTMARS